ncbi:DUF885 family protein [Niabella terrae]
MTLPVPHKFLLLLFGLSQLWNPFNVLKAQAPPGYEHTTPLEPVIVQYQQDLQAVNYFYGPMPQGWWVRSPAVTPPEQSEALLKIQEQYLQRLQALNFQQLGTNGQVDYILLKRKLESAMADLHQQQEQYQRLHSYYPFADALLGLEQKRRRGHQLDAAATAALLTEKTIVVEGLDTATGNGPELKDTDARFITSLLRNLRDRLKSVYEFYNDYDPEFSWWIPQPYKALDTALHHYIQTLQRKSDRQVYHDGSQISGSPIGRKALEKQLREAWISYSPEELLRLADQEFSWCEKEMLKATQEMGLGTDWKAALEKVKNTYVPLGQQPELINQLYEDAQAFIAKNQLIKVPELADQTWGMIMMSPERQLVNPFFTGGREISISYPTSSMSQQDKLMSMRGNNPYFSRGTVQHELIPGHHLQYFMTSRYKPYRAEIFGNPFWTEGWALYWELLLYSKGFAQTPEQRIGMLFWRMHRCARITFSIKFHLGQWTPRQCVDYLVDKVGHERANAHGEVKRSFEGMYGPLYQLAYLVGGLQFMHLKYELVDSGKMSYIEFHDRILKENYLPIELLRAVLLNQPLRPDYETRWRFYDFKH